MGAVQPSLPSSLRACVLLLSCVATALLPAQTPEASTGVPAGQDSVKSASVDAIPLDELREFARVYAGIRASYVDEVDGKRLMHAATIGMLRALDPHSEYYDAKTLAKFDEDMRGRYAGIGVEMVTFAGMLQVLAVVEDSPAARAGVLAGDVIETIDGKPVGAHRNDADQLRGPQDSTIVLGVRREGRADPLKLSIKRAPLNLPSVTSEWIEPGIALVAMRQQIRERSALELRQHLAALRGKQTLRGLVLDLRGNIGGVLPAAVAISDSFLDAGRIVRTRSRLPELAATFDAHEGDLAQGAAIVVLVDGMTASAAELIAAALKDNGRARVVGTRTFGKGSVQTVVPLDGGGAIKLTTARYFTPKDRSLQSAGVLPDVDLATSRTRAQGGGALARASPDAGDEDPELAAAVRELHTMLTRAP